MALLASRGLGHGGGLGGMLGGGRADHAPSAGHAVGPSGIDTSVLYPGGGPVGGGVAGGVVDPSAGPLGGSTDEMGGGFGGGLGGRATGLDGILGGGLGSLIERFSRSGHGDILGSWIGTGENRRITPGELHHVLGDDTIDALAEETGMPRRDLLAELSETLPDVVDRLTPEGRVPDDDEMGRWV
ncbi:MAG TPA: YidB family protein [Beijerinckiaceae bacterium]|nr:YidB family protein [Beijerinckiaceae bacterium]